MKKINLELEERSYNLNIGIGSFDSILEQINKLKLNYNIFVVVDKNVDKYHSQKIKKAFKGAEQEVFFHYMRSDETRKTFNEVNKIYSDLLKCHFGRDTLMVAIGGGLLGDIAGFAASTFMRGIPLIIVPTTLLSCLDSSIGGKNGINFENKKNIVGTFYQPKSVIIDPEFLTSLPKKEMVSGMGELIKYTMLSDYNFFIKVNNYFNDIIDKDIEILEEVIYKGASLKCSIIEQDEHEKGVRKILNLGHTFGHSFESNLKFKITHGESVVAGIIASLFLAEKLNIIMPAKKDLFLKLLTKIKLPKNILSLKNEDVYETMYADKKIKNRKINFILLQDIGNTLLDIEVPQKDVFYAMDKLKEFV
jgi:3-dehydroquinate synthase